MVDHKVSNEVLQLERENESLRLMRDYYKRLYIQARDELNVRTRSMLDGFDPSLDYRGYSHWGIH